MSGKTQLTFNEYDHILDIFEKMNSPAYWPTLEQLDIMREKPEEWILFACYLSEKAKEPKNNTEKYSKKNLSAFIHEYLELVDEEKEVRKKPMMVPDFLKGCAEN